MQINSTIFDKLLLSNDIFASSSVPTTHVNANPVVEPKVAVQPTQPTASQSQPEEIESLF